MNIQPLAPLSLGTARTCELVLQQYIPVLARHKLAYSAYALRSLRRTLREIRAALAAADGELVSTLAALPDTTDEVDLQNLHGGGRL